MTRRSLVLFLIAICAGCKPAAERRAASAGAPRLQATVVTIRTAVQPEEKTWTHEIVIADGRARLTAEQDTWRIFNTATNTVTFVDDVARTVRTVPLDALIRQRRTALANTLPAYFPRARVTRTGESRSMLGVTAQKIVIEVGAYRREMWVAGHPRIPPELFAMIESSDVPSSPLAPIMRPADEVLTAIRGFPLADRAEVPFGDGKMIVERNVVGIQQREVPADLLEPPKTYLDLTPKPKKP